MKKDDGFSSSTSQKENCELRIELPLALVAKLAQHAASRNVTLEQFLAEQVIAQAESAGKGTESP